MCVMSLLELIGNYLMAEFVQCTGMPDVPACSYILSVQGIHTSDRQTDNQQIFQKPAPICERKSP